ncbi:MAG TPA: cation diffusion facilitator family transporter [Gemmatimonadales bacterium]|nr:cation diffusion facilitator family transporter [Gemmatimonadales bacterium]
MPAARPSRPRPARQLRREGAARDRTALVRRVLIGLFFANLAVVGAKVAVGLAARSLAVLGDALHSSVDALNNILALVVVRVAAQAPDEDHPYGHGKFETLGALAIVGFLSVTCFELARDAVTRLWGAHTVPRVTGAQLLILVGGLGVNALVAWYEHRRGEELQSELLVSDAAHTRSDVYITTGVIAGLLLSRRGWWWADPALALVIAAFIVRVAYQIIQRTVPILVDERALPRGEIQSVAEAVDGVRGAYDIRSRGGGQTRYAEVTIAVDPATNVAAAHAIADEVERRLKRDLRLETVTVHVEPC